MAQINKRKTKVDTPINTIRTKPSKINIITLILVIGLYVIEFEIWKYIEWVMNYVR